MVGGQAGVGERGDLCWFGAGGELDDGARGGLEQLGHAAGAHQAGQVGAPGAPHVISSPAGAAHAAGEVRVADDRVADGQVLDRRADGVDPAGVFMAEDDGQVGRDDVGEPAVDDVQVGAAQPGAADPDDDVLRPGRLGFWHVVQARRLPV